MIAQNREKAIAQRRAYELKAQLDEQTQMMA
jgi:hypothetical protein